jgi:importin subunit beta-1
MLNEIEKVSVQAYEFWCSIADEEVTRIKENRQYRGYIQMAFHTLYKIIEIHLLKRDVEREKVTEDSWTNIKAASCLLTSMSQCVSDEIIAKVFQFISNNIVNENAKIRDSVFLAFGSILETRWKEKIREIIGEALPTILSMLNDKNTEVRNTVAWCVKKMCEYHSVSLKYPPSYDQMMTAIISSLNSNKRVVIQLCDAIHFLCYNLKPDVYNGETTGLISNYFEGLLYKLLEIAITKDAYDPNNNVAVAALFALGSLIDYAPLDCYNHISNFFPQIFNAFQSTLQPEKYINQEARFAYQSYFATIISACFVGGDKVKLTLDDAKTVYANLESSFKERGNVYEEGLMACSSLALSLGNDFAPFINSFGSFLVYGLSQIQDASICRISINCTSDLLRTLGPQFNDYMFQITPHILEILRV